MDPISASFFIGAVVGGTLGNRSDRLFCWSMRPLVTEMRERLARGEPPVNGDVQRAVRKAALQAAVVVCDERLKRRGVRVWAGRVWDTGRRRDEEVQWLRAVRDDLCKELGALRDQTYEVATSAALTEVELLLRERPGAQAQERIAELRRRLEDELLEELRGLGHRSQHGRGPAP